MSVSSVAAAYGPPLLSSVFSHDFERKAASYVLRDVRFARATLEYLKPEYFTNAIHRNIVLITQDFVRRYDAVPAMKTLAQVIGRSAAITAAEKPLYAKEVVDLCTVDIAEIKYVREKIDEFSKHQAALLLAIDMPRLINNGQYQKIEERVKGFNRIGQDGGPKFYDYFATAGERQAMRDEVANGHVELGVTTGYPEIDHVLYRQGWPRGGLIGIMGHAKMGKTALMLGSAAMSAVNQGINSLYLSFEVSLDILTDRIDALLSGFVMGDLITSRDQIAATIRAIGQSPGVGKIWPESHPTSTVSVDGVEKIIEAYFNTGRIPDVIFVDYLGILEMDDPKDRYTSLGNAGKGLRALAGKYNVPIIIGVQSNRGSVGKAVNGMENIGESFAIVQDLDLLISINADDAEMAAGVRRLFFAASRNEASKTITVQGDLEKMRMIETIIGVT